MNQKLLGSSGKPFRIIDAIYLLVSVPLVLTVFHEYVICTIAPGIGMHWGDRSQQCTIGWGFLVVMLFIPVWAILTLVIAPIRLNAISKLGGVHSPVFWLYVLGALIPIPLLLAVFFG